MHEFRCPHTECNERLTSSDKDDLMGQVSRHLQEVHKIESPTQSLLNYLMGTALTRSSARSAR